MVTRCVTSPMSRQLIMLRGLKHTGRKILRWRAATRFRSTHPKSCLTPIFLKCQYGQKISQTAAPRGTTTQRRIPRTRTSNVPVIRGHFSLGEESTIGQIYVISCTCFMLGRVDLSTRSLCKLALGHHEVLLRSCSSKLTGDGPRPCDSSTLLRSTDQSI